MKVFNSRLQEAFQTKSVLKVITGIHNTNIQQVMKIAKAAELSNATYLDVASNTYLVKMLKSFSRLPICISSIDPVDIYNGVSSGADLVEIGNYDFFYDQGIYLNKEQILELSKEIKCLVYNVDICVTIPYYLNLADQISLAKDLQLLGINFIQTEGISKINCTKFDINLTKSPSSFYNLHNSFIPSLLSTYFISEFIDLPIIAASGYKNIFGPIAKFYGAYGIGIGSAVYKEIDIISMSNYINQTYNSLSLFSSLNSFSDIESELSKLPFSCLENFFNI
uniref:Uncharacterized protein ycf23 n=1 Tax=Vertebrata australis TaxID=1967852 RepID=A0A1Z1MI47_9FLOR|nr:hypothetical protein [Vertebrata australis]ARW65747.1 hypothetical protein [Vertebrata australis]